MRIKIIILSSLVFFMSYVHGESNSYIVPFELTQSGHILVTAKINGREGRFIFDTGAGINLLIKKFADKTPNLEKSEHFYTGHRSTGEELMMDIWKLNNLQIGKFSATNEICSVYDIDFPFDGLISLTPFLSTPITIDFLNKQLIIETKRSIKKRISSADYQIPIKIHNDKGISIDIATNIKLNDTLDLLVNLDSGSGFGSYKFNYRYMSNLNIDTSNVKKIERESMFKSGYYNTHYFTKVNQLSDINNNVITKQINAQFITGLIYEGIVGINWIGSIITFDLANKRLIVKK
ncbi:MAG: retropepsin-like domain-containing protein [Bacteroidetes bacterium]|nr:retropepsin-like domain-containing protein [Bacteroidota bacterium]